MLGFITTRSKINRDIQVDNKDLETNKVKLQQKKKDLERQAKDLAVEKADKDKEYKKLQSINESIANEIRRIKTENDELEKQTDSKDEFLKQQQTELVQRDEYKKKLGKKRRFLCG